MMYLILDDRKPTFNKDLALWWAPGGNGYTVDVNKAGRFSDCAAREIVRGTKKVIVSEEDAIKLTRQVVIYGDVHRLIPNAPCKRSRC